MTQAEQEERHRLDSCLERIHHNISSIGARLRAYAEDVKTSKIHMWDARRDMDHLEKVAIRQSIEQRVRSGEVLREQQNKLLKLKRSPYFGRFDFRRAATNAVEEVYVGVHDFRDDELGKTLVYDWRAPISSMFYDYEIGPARYDAPSGCIAGELQRKRQFRIRDGQMEFMIESEVNIVDDVLQRELSRSSDEGMKNIVATIQRDQNAIIRDADAHTLIIQGVAGSGKTSIALHRIAFLLYRFKDTLSSNDILIISPNRVFADYIGNVLPELGEERVQEIGMEKLADELLEGKYRFQTFFEQTAEILEKDDCEMKERVHVKSSLEFLGEIDRYAAHLETESFQASDWRTGSKIVPAWFLEETWRKYRGAPLTERVGHVVAAAAHKMGIYYNYDLRSDERRALREAVRGMTRGKTLREAYKGLFNWMGRPALFKPAGGKLEYADVFPLIYLKLRIEGVENMRKEVKHLLIDEMQDYSPVQYAVLARLFNCRKTILGDATQSVNPYAASTAEQIQKILRSGSRVELTRSYRSSWEIMQFALAISPNERLIPMERHGEAPHVTICQNQSDMVKRVISKIERFKGSEHKSLAIIAKTQKQATKLHLQISRAGVEALLLDATSVGLSTGVVVCTPHFAKGLEFDRVIVFDASDVNYRTEMDRNLLYVACTRAMHKLSALSLSEPSSFLPSKVIRVQPRTLRE